MEISKQSFINKSGSIHWWLCTHCCAISNKFVPPLARTSTDDEHLAVKMRYLSHQKNHLQYYVLENGLDRRSVIWKPIYGFEGFPRLNKEDLRTLYVVATNYVSIQVTMKAMPTSPFIRRIQDWYKLSYSRNTPHPGNIHNRSSLMRQMFLQPTASVELELESSECALTWQRCFGFLGIPDMKKE